MQVTVESTGSLGRRMRVEIPESRIEGEVKGRLQNMTRTVRLPGFRPGKVPFKVVARRFGPRVRDEVVGEVVRSSFFEAVTQEKLRPAGSPVIDPLEASEGSGLSYTAAFDIFPEIAPPVLENLSVRRPSARVEDADVEKMLETLRRQRRTWTEVSRPATNGDRVTISFEGLVDGARQERTSAKDVAVELGSGRLLDGFEAGLVGVSSGESRTLELEFPPSYPAEDLAGKPVVFEVAVSTVEEGKLPEIDDEFAASFGVSMGGMDGFRAEVRRNMDRELEDAVRAACKQRVMAALLEAHPIDLPGSLVSDEVSRLIEQRRQELAQRGIPPSAVTLDHEMFEKPARRRVALGLLLAEVVKSNGLQADPAKVRERVETVASTYEQPQEVVAWYYSDRNRLGDIESIVLEESVVDWILARARVEDESMSFDALLNPGQTSTS